MSEKRNPANSQIPVQGIREDSIPAYHIAVVLSAGRGTRMQSDIPKQYLPLAGVPVLSHSLRQFQEFPGISEIILVTGSGEEDFCREKIIEPYGFTKVSAVIAGGAQRYDSVYAALKEIRRRTNAGLCPPCGCVMIHDGARPLIDGDLLTRNLRTAVQRGSAVTGMPVKDTIKRCGEENAVAETPPRDRLWQVQTPQTFLFDELIAAYEKLFAEGSAQGITDDAMVMERCGRRPVYMCEGSYRNLKITTQEDLACCAALLNYGK